MEAGAMRTCSLLICVVVVETTRRPAALNSAASRNIDVVLPPPPTNDTTSPRSTRNALPRDNHVAIIALQSAVVSRQSAVELDSAS